MPVDYTEVMVTRRVYRTGEGEYYINKSACRLKDIVELFRDTGIGKDGYSIIGQGRIDEILSQKSEDRRGIFEEAAGIVKYRTRKEESEKRLSNMRDNLARVEDIIAELETQLEPLEKASETARRYLSLRDELRVLECSAFVLRSDRAKERIEEAQQLLTGLREAIANEEKRTEELSAAREQANEQTQTLENDVTAAHNAVLELTRETEERGRASLPCSVRKSPAWKRMFLRSIRMRTSKKPEARHWAMRFARTIGKLTPTAGRLSTFSANWLRRKKRRPPRRKRRAKPRNALKAIRARLSTP